MTEHYRAPIRALGSMLLMLAVLLGVLAAPAQAASTETKIACQGFVKCNVAMMGNYGYDLVYQQKFWNMKAGHNCTNYVAYRLTHNGRMTVKPGGTSNAAQWGTAAKAAGIPVTTSPKRGDVAWWPSKYHGVGVLGHVAIVEKVYSDGSVLVSQDNWNNDFGYMKIGSKSDTFPKAFIRYPQSDGTPQGKVSSVRVLAPDAGSSQRRVEFTGSLSDPDAPRTVDGRDSALRFEWSDGKSSDVMVQSSFRWTFSKPDGDYTVRVIAKNVGAGRDVVLATHRVVVSAANEGSVIEAAKVQSRVLLSAPSKVSRRSRAVVKVTVRASDTASNGGTLRVYDGSRRIASKSVSGTKTKVRLPKMRKGTHRISVQYSGNTDVHASASAVRKIRVR